MIHTVNLDDDTLATLKLAAQDSPLTLLEFEAWILEDWARNWRVKDHARQEFLATVEALKNATPHELAEAMEDKAHG